MSVKGRLALNNLFRIANIGFCHVFLLLILHIVFKFCHVDKRNGDRDLWLECIDRTAVHLGEDGRAGADILPGIPRLKIRLESIINSKREVDQRWSEQLCKEDWNPARLRVRDIRGLTLAVESVRRGCAVKQQAKVSRCTIEESSQPRHSSFAHPPE